MKHSWETRNISSVFNFDKGVLQSSKNTAGSFTFITASEDFKTHNDYFYDTEALCFAFAASGSLGRTHYFNGKFIASDLVYVLTPKDDYRDKIDLRFYYYFLNHFKEEIVRMTKSGTSKASINREAFSTIQIPILPLKVQKKILSILEKVKPCLEEVSSLREKQTKEINNLLFSKYIDLIGNAEWSPMKEVAPIIRRSVILKDDALYPELGVRCFGNGTFHKLALTGMEVATKKIFQIKTGDLVFSNVFAWEGGIAVAKEDDNDRYGSHRFISCIADKEKAFAEFLCYHFLSPKGLEDINACSPGGAGRNRTLGLDKLMKILVPLPPIELQKDFVALLTKMSAIKEYQKETERELSELMPSLLDKAFKGELLSDREMHIQKKGILSEVQQEVIALPLAESYKSDLELAIIVALMESKLGNTYGEVGIQKTVFNIEAFSPVLSLKYNFVNYHYGTYSAELKENIKLNPFLGKKVIKGTEVFTLSPIHKKTVLNAISDKANLDLVISVNHLLDIYTSPFISKHTDKIELLNTVTKLIMDLQTVEVNKIYEGMKHWEIKQQGFKSKADKFDISNTAKTIDLLISNGLVSKLLE